MYLYSPYLTTFCYFVQKLNKIHQMTSIPLVFLTFLCINKTPVFINVLHILLNDTTGEMISLIVVLNSLGILQRHYEFELLPIGKCPHIIVNLIVLSPNLEAHIILDLEEMIAHLVIRQNLWIRWKGEPIQYSSSTYHRVMFRCHRSIHPIPIIIISPNDFEG